MKKYLFGLGAMLVGAGLMFVLMHGEVSAEGERKVAHCEYYESATRFGIFPNNEDYIYSYCKVKDLTCVYAHNGFSCVKS